MGKMNGTFKLLGVGWDLALNWKIAFFSIRLSDSKSDSKNLKKGTNLYKYTN